MNGTKAGLDIQGYVDSFMNTMVGVITNPAGFYRGMPKSGGLVEPLIFMVVMGVISGLIHSLMALFGLGGYGASFLMAGAAVILTPIFTAIFGFVSGAILYAIWKAMGSREPFEVAFRCGAYATAITPLTALAGMIPYIGPLAGIVWMTYLMVIASTEVHTIEAKKAWIVMGTIGALIALVSFSSELKARRLATQMNQWEKQVGKVGEMSPEEAGKKVGEFLKGMQEATGKK